MGVMPAGELKHCVSSSRRMLRQSSSTRRAPEWPPSDVTSDLTIEIGTTTFSLHKFPLVSKSGKIRKLLSDTKDLKVVRISLQGVPGGPEGFELAAKFCYGVNIDITITNVAMLHCAAHYLQLTEEFSEKNLEIQTEFFLMDVVFPDVINSISVLHHCESLVPLADEINLVTRLITAVATKVCTEQLSAGLSKLDGFSTRNSTVVEVQPPHDSWEMTLAVLNLDLFQRVLCAMKSRGLKQETVSKILVNYAHRSVHGIPIRDIQLSRRTTLDADTQKKQRVVLEVIVGLLPSPSRKSPVPMPFLSGLLKTATLSSASPICKADLERRIGLRLDEAILEDMLIPANPQSSNSQQLYDTDSVSRIFSIFLNMDDEQDDRNHTGEERDIGYDSESPRSPKQSSIHKSSKLMDSYLAEIALDSNLMTSKFITLAELLPDHARVVDDGLYRAVDIFLKVHPNIKESERYRLCKAIDCQKLSQEACSHAAQNERLPVQMAVQVLYFEQMRLRNAMNGNHEQFFIGSMNGQFPQRSGSGVGSGAVSPRDNYASVRRENRELKLEVARMRMRLTELEKEHVTMKRELVRSNPANKILKSFTRKLSQLSALFRLRDFKTMNTKTTHDSRFMFPKRRRNSIS